MLLLLPLNFLWLRGSAAYCTMHNAYDTMPIAHCIMHNANCTMNNTMHDAYCTWWSAVMGKTLHHSHIQVTLVTLWSHTLEWSNIQYCHNSTLEHLRQRRVNRLELTSSNQEEGLICGPITSQSTPLTRDWETLTHKQKHTEVNTNTNSTCIPDKHTTFVIVLTLVCSLSVDPKEWPHIIGFQYLDLDLDCQRNFAQIVTWISLKGSSTKKNSIA